MVSVVEDRCFRADDGLILRLRSWRPNKEARAVVLLVHGYGEHMGRYDTLAKRFVDSGFQVVSFDMRGHGSSPGTRALISSFEQLEADLALFIKEARPEHSRYFLLGHSLGGGLLAYHVAKHSTDALGVVLSSPLIELPDPPGAALRLINRVMALLAPEGKLPSMFYHFDTSTLSRIAAEVAAYESDPLVYHDSIRNRTAFEIFRLTQELPRWMGRFRAPVLTLHGEADRLTSIKGSRLFHRSIPSSDKSLRTYPLGHHELFNDLCRDRVFEDVVQWLNQRSAT